jgi:hypothetical protein
MAVIITLHSAFWVQHCVVGIPDDRHQRLKPWSAYWQPATIYPCSAAVTSCLPIVFHKFVLSNVLLCKNMSPDTPQENDCWSSWCWAQGVSFFFSDLPSNRGICYQSRTEQLSSCGHLRTRKPQLSAWRSFMCSISLRRHTKRASIYVINKHTISVLVHIGFVSTLSRWSDNVECLWRGRLKLTVSCSHKAIYVSSRKRSWWPMCEIFTLDGAPSLMLPLLKLVYVVCNFSKIRSVCGHCDMAYCALLLWRTVMFTCSCSSFFMNSHFRMRLPTRWYFACEMCVHVCAYTPIRW